MYLEVQQKIRERFVQTVRETFGQEVDEPVIAFPPSVEMGDLSITSCFELAKQFRQPPRKIAEQIAPRLLPLEGVERVTVAGAGYLNFYLERPTLAASLFDLSSTPVTGKPASQPGTVSRSEPTDKHASPGASPKLGAEPASQPKILVEHTSINPNKAAHIGHLRNAVLGDAFARLLRFRGRAVEVQNYIDNTGVQVADVVVGFAYVEKKSLDEVRSQIASTARFDYYCWDLYARVSQWYQDNRQALILRAGALKAIEEGRGEQAAMADLVSTAIVRLHLDTMLRLGVRYDLLVRESEILRLDFWKSAFELMKQKGAIRYEDSGKNRGCWVMGLSDPSEAPASDGSQEPDEATEDTETEAGEDVKIIVRSNGTVTYVGKDIAYHLWKFGLLGRDFGYQPFYTYADAQRVWCTGSPAGNGGSASVGAAARAPQFGRASATYAVIDIRQSYVQNVVRAAFHALGYHQQAANLHHFSYEVVGLSPGCAEEMGVTLGEGDRLKGYVEVSGRKGLGVKADDLIDRLMEKAGQEVRDREMTTDPAEQEACARMIGVAALRYFLLKFTRRALIAFDFKDALAFEGETGPYLQYSVVRARNIFRKFEEARGEDGARVVAAGSAGANLPPAVGAVRAQGGDNPAGQGSLASQMAHVSRDQLARFFSGPTGDTFWELALLAAQLEMVAEQAISAEEPAVLAKYAFRLAQAFNNFYHHHHILNEPDRGRQQCLLYLVYVVNQTLCRALDVLGIEVPERM